MILLAVMMVAVGANAQETEPVRIDIPWGNAWLLTGGGPPDDAPAPFLPADAVIFNRGNVVYVRVMDAAGTTQLRGFTLDRGEATVRVDEGERLLVDAVGGDTLALRSAMSVLHLKCRMRCRAWRSMLINSGLTSIALEIPGTMNPNLSPESRKRSSPRLRQEILFKGRVLLTVGPDLEPGTNLDVRALIRAQD